MKQLSQKIFPMELPVNRALIIYIMAQQESIPRWIIVMLSLFLMIQIAAFVLISTAKYVKHNLPFKEDY